MTRLSVPLAARWLSLAATPTFAAMALLTAVAGPGPLAVLCGAGGWPLDGMVIMYLLMSVFHASPWLKRIPERGGDITATEAGALKDVS